MVRMKWININSLSGLRPNRIPDELHPERDGMTLVNSLEAATGCRVKGGIFDVSSIAALAGVNRHYLEGIISSDPKASFIYREGSFFATMPNSFVPYWEEHKSSKQAGQRARAALNQPKATRAAFEKLLDLDDH